MTASEATATMLRCAMLLMLDDPDFWSSSLARKDLVFMSGRRCEVVCLMYLFLAFKCPDFQFVDERNLGMSLGPTVECAITSISKRGADLPSKLKPPMDVAFACRSPCLLVSFQVWKVRQ